MFHHSLLARVKSHHSLLLLAFACIPLATIAQAASDLCCIAGCFMGLYLGPQGFICKLCMTKAQQLFWLMVVHLTYISHESTSQVAENLLCPVRQHACLTLDKSLLWLSFVV